MLNQLNPNLLRYLCAPVSVALALLLRLLLDPVLGEQFPLVTAFWAIVFTAWYGGMLPALLAVVLGYLGTMYFIIPLHSAVNLADDEQLNTLFRYGVVGAATALLGGAMQKARLRGERNAADAQHQAALIDQVYDAVLVWDWQGTLTFWNRGAEELYGYARAEALGQVCHQLLDPNATVGLEQVMNSLTTKGMWQGELSHRTRGGQRVWVESRMVRIDEGNRVYVIETNRDSTSRRTLESLRNDMQTQLEQQVQQRTVELVKSEQRYRSLIQATAQIVWRTDADGLPLDASLSEYTGLTAAQIANGDYLYAASTADRDQLIAAWRHARQTGEAFHCECIVRRASDGQLCDMMVSMVPLSNAAQQIEEWVGILRDVSERKNLEAQLRQSQKLEAFGQLAGGVAHDFNNLLMVISGYSSLLLAALNSHEESYKFANEIHRAGERAAALTGQLLAFTRQQMLEPQIVDLNDVVKDIESMLLRVIGEDIRLQSSLVARACSVRVEPGQVEQVIMNLVVNARDAMPQGGRLLIETAEVEVGAVDRKMHPQLKAGRFAVLSVSDTGSGMTPAVRARIFEPFFTTKCVGKGTGLGLAVVHGIVKQSGGSIEVQTQEGQGTVFRIYLPIVNEVTPVLCEVDARPSGMGYETILLVEDDAGVRELVARSLQVMGYKVLQAMDGRAALQLLTSCQEKIDLLVTDVVMPEVGGRQVAEAFKRSHPGAKVLFVSGYTNDEVVRHGVLQSETAFLQKPFTLNALTSKVRDSLSLA